MPEVLVCCQNSSAVRWSLLPLPDEAESHLAGVGFLVGDHVGQRRAGRRGGHHQHVGGLHHHGDGIKVFQGVVVHLDQVGGDHKRTQRRHKQGVAIGGRARHLGGAYGAGGTGFVVHDDGGAAELLTQLGRDGAGDLVGGAPRGKGHQQGDGFGGPGQSAQAGGGRQGQGDQGLLHIKLKPGRDIGVGAWACASQACTPWWVYWGPKASIRALSSSISPGFRSDRGARTGPAP